MGYNSFISLNFRDTICYVNQEVHRIEKKQPDLILVGAQSNSSLYYPGNIRQYPTYQMELLFGTLPDAVVLCVNCFDSLDFIQRTVATIEAVSFAQVIAIGIYPLQMTGDGLLSNYRRINKSSIDEKKAEVYAAFSKPVFTVGEANEMRDLFEHVIEWFLSGGIPS